jgi:FKBP-type peptidyl-prolyl cis-trans isomerase FkpA
MESYRLRTLFSALLITTVLWADAQDNKKKLEPPLLKNRNDSINYFFGLNVGYSLEKAPFVATSYLISKGLTDAIEGTTIYDPQASSSIFAELQKDFKTETTKKELGEAQKNLEEGYNFLAANGERKGVVTTSSGLQYRIKVQGDGPMPADTSTVTVHYEGTLMKGQVFDSSYGRGEPATFPLNGVIRGWREGVQLMPVGSTYVFYIPPNLAYGEMGQGRIPPNAVLIFQIELLGIE